MPGENLEVDVRPGRTTARFLVFRNIARMGSYRDALAQRGRETPDITLSRLRGHEDRRRDQRRARTDGSYENLRPAWLERRAERVVRTHRSRSDRGDAVRHTAVRHSPPARQLGVAAVSNALSGAH